MQKTGQCGLSLVARSHIACSIHLTYIVSTRLANICSQPAHNTQKKIAFTVLEGKEHTGRSSQYVCCSVPAVKCILPLGQSVSRHGHSGTRRKKLEHVFLGYVYVYMYMCVCVRVLVRDDSVTMTEREREYFRGVFNEN